jgi:hypothetical protein
MKMPPDGLGSFARDDGGKGFCSCLLHIAQAAEVSEQALPGLRTDAGNVEQF